MILKPKQALNKAYLKVKPTREQIKLFKDNLIKLIDEINLDKREELHKNDFSAFLKDTYYKTSNYINIKDTIDLVIHSSSDPQSPVSILIEAKSPTNKFEMISIDNINTKSMQELILYYLRERISNNNLNLKHLIITNRYEWFIFDAVLFEKLFAQNKQLVSQFNDFEDKILSVTTTKDFYSEIAKPFIETIKDKIEYTYFDIREYKKYLENSSLENDSKLIPLYKIFSPEHLLKLPIANDNNSLDKSFYNELLHIIGLEETKQGSKKIITRKDSSRRDNGSLLENCITELDNGDKLSSITNIEHYGTTKEERLFNVALELVIIWINRILFLKLLEGQLINFNKNSKDYAFLNSNTIKGYDDLNNLFFGVLAKQQNERSENNKKLFAKIPYLNSSLFDPQSEALEKSCFAISALNYNRTLTIDTKTVLKDRAGKRLTGEKNTLEYLFEFLNAYNFASDSSDEIQEDSKTIISAAVLGLIFEKINGYKDGSFYTPSFITMYMCRETIRRAVVEQFNKAKSWNCLSFDDLYDKIEDRNEANNIINSITICDPAVGSGHFLVSALNEIISIKSELKLLEDRNGKRLKEYQVEIINDELIVTDEDGDLFTYNPTSNESQRVQEALFHEKQAIIENCLFGVDINPNSVKICRLRLWIELLKNTYYKNKENHELETLPNIDINIKCGNSLISRNELHENLAPILETLKHDGNNQPITVDYYRRAVLAYKQAKTKDEKGKLEKLINKVKQEFSIGLYQASLFDEDSNKKFEMEVFYNKQNAFEWRFEFPEVLADDGEYKGFDVVIGNPPYIQLQLMRHSKMENDLLNKTFVTFAKTGDIYALFIEKGVSLLKQGGLLSYITSNKWMRAGYGKSLRQFLAVKTQPISLVDFGGFQVFDSAAVDSNILITQNQLCSQSFNACTIKDDYSPEIPLSNYFHNHSQSMPGVGSESWIIASAIEQHLKSKIDAKGIALKDWNININYGIKTGLNEAFIIDSATKDRLCADDPKSAEIIKPILRGRDIKRYKSDWAGLWLINSHNNPTINIENYPAIKNHLDNFYSALEQRQDKGSTSYNLRNCAYLAEFEKEKIVWARLMRVHKTEDTSFPRFALVKEGEFVVDSLCFITANHSIIYLLAVLNSKYAANYFYKNIAILDNGGMQMRQQYIENLLIPQISSQEQQPFIDITNRILLAKEQQQDTTELEQQIDEMIYKLYDLTDEEIEIIEGTNNESI